MNRLFTVVNYLKLFSSVGNCTVRIQTCIFSLDHRKEVSKSIHPIVHEDLNKTLYQKRSMKEILVDYSKEFLLLNELNSMRIHREIEELAKLDVNHTHMIEKDRLNRSEKVFQAFRPEVSNEENSRSIPIEKKINLEQSKKKSRRLQVDSIRDVSFHNLRFSTDEISHHLDYFDYSK